MTVAAIILARGGSKGIPNKNLQKIGGMTLVERAVVSAQNTKNIQDIFVSSDSKLILAEAKEKGANIIVRPDNISQDHSSSESGWLQAIEEIQKQNQYDYFVFVQCTSPFIKSCDLDDAIDMLQTKQLGCVFSATEDHSFLWQELKGLAKALNHDSKKIRQRRQDLQVTVKETGAFYCVKTDIFLREKNRFCGRLMYFQVSSFSIDIDKEEDIVIANALSNLR